MSSIAFLKPAWLWLLLLAPVFLWPRGRHSKLRGAAIVGLRLTIFALLVGVLAEPARVRESEGVAVYFLLDRSGSVPQSMQESCLSVVREAAKEKPGARDRVGVVVFGENAIVEERPAENLDLERVLSVVEEEGTDLSAAIRVALSTLPEDQQCRLVLASDGNETRGNLLAALDRAAALGCPIDVLPLEYRHDSEVLVEALSVPRRVEAQEPFEIRCTVTATAAAQGRLTLLADEEAIASREVALSAGTNVFLFTHRLAEPGFHLFEANLEVPGDGVARNNVGRAYTILEGSSIVLLAGGTREDVRHVEEALREERIASRVRITGNLPRDLGEWQSYDAIVFASLSAESLTREQMGMVRSLVRDLGAGFVMIGGEGSFGSGGWYGTPIAEILPVNLDLEHERAWPSGGIAIVLDHVWCIGDRWSKDICAGTIRSLSRFDRFGLQIGGREDWVIPLRPAEDPEELVRIVNGSVPGDVENIDPYLDRIRAAFGRTRCARRHAVIITDGTGDIVPSDGSIDALRKAGITLSVVVIEPRGQNLAALARAAQLGGGNCYVVQPHEYRRVPQIFVREAAIVKKGLYFEERFTPQARDPSEILDGILPSDIPPLDGYNVTSKRQPSEIALVSGRGDPILAQWRCGTGKVVAFTSDATSRWGKDWVSWDKFRRFWSQAVRWSLRRLPRSPYRLAIQKGRREGTGEAILDCEDSSGNFVDFLKPRGILVDPALESSELVFDQIGPGRYRAVFPAEHSGGYVVNVQYEEEGKTYLLRGGYVPPYDPEYARLSHDAALLSRIADRTGGRVLGQGDSLFEPTGAVARVSEPIGSVLLAIAICLFPLDVFLRRVVFGRRDLAAVLCRVLPFFRRRIAALPDVVAAERASIEARAAWKPSRTSTSPIEDEAAPAKTTESPTSEPELPEFSLRLRQAKDRARKEYDRP